MNVTNNGVTEAADTDELPDYAAALAEELAGIAGKQSRKKRARKYEEIAAICAKVAEGGILTDAERVTYGEIVSASSKAHRLQRRYEIDAEMRAARVAWESNPDSELNRFSREAGASNYQ